jgi:hypothetical protein
MKNTLVTSVSVAFLFFFLMSGFLVAQEPVTSAESTDPKMSEVNLEQRVDQLEANLAEDGYTRIPNKDFENLLDGKIQKSLREIVNWWLFVIAALISLLGFLVNKYARSYLQTTIEGQVNQLKTENEETIRGISNQYFSSVIGSLLDFKIETINKSNHRVEEAVVDDLKNYLHDESITIPEHKKVALIDTIMRCYYFSKYPQRIEKMINLIKEFEAKFLLLSTTYANAAIAFNDMYDRYGAKQYLNDAIENCNKSIRILPDYGLAFALKLELNMMAITKAFDEEERKVYEQELLKVFKDIDNNTSTYLCKELIKRFEVDKATYMEPYLTRLYNDYPDELARIEARAKEAGV